LPRRAWRWPAARRRNASCWPLAARRCGGCLFRAGRLSVPWRGLLSAYAAGQLAGRLVPLPGGIGGVEGGMLGALTLTGTASVAAAAAVTVYRVAGCWAVGAPGPAVAAALARRSPGGPGRDASHQPDGPPP